MAKTEIKLPKGNPKFPLWAKGIDDDQIVNFTSEKQGVVWSEGEAIAFPIGYISADWISCFDKAYWEILPKGTVISTTI